MNDFDLAKLKDVDVQNIDPESLVDINEIHIDETLTKIVILQIFSMCSTNIIYFDAGIYTSIFFSALTRFFGDCSLLVLF